MRFIKTLSIVSMFLVLSLSACGGTKRHSNSSHSSFSSESQSSMESDSSSELVQISTEQAKERVASYNPEVAVNPYSSVEITISYEFIKATGEFDERTGVFQNVTTSLKQALESQNGTRTEGEDYLPSAVLKISDIEMYESMSGTKLSFYPYLNTGLIMEVTMVQVDDDVHSVTTSQMSLYILDDGRMEKSDGYALIKLQGPSYGGSYEGELEYQASTSLRWIHK